ncbi:MAG: GGDEF domain-containing protein [Proteobacteria bacterium]|nr:GGDEF domain-containing protein [Pseudomonadota bacterium]MBI3495782.1 GGDEF domain-containing protein [Pseudomonadota bacterium]
MTVFSKRSKTTVDLASAPLAPETPRNIGLLARRATQLAEASGLALARLDEGVIQLALRAIEEAERKLEQQRQRIDYLESLSVTDELTQIKNRRGFMIELKRALAESKRSGKGGVLLMIDLDGFKAINDIHGHAAGDEVLAHAAAMLNGHVRPSDCVARLGGDEFAVLMPETTAERGFTRARDLSKLLNGQLIAWQGTVLPLQASIGVAAYRPGQRPDELLQDADAGLYRDKRKKPSRQRRIAGH